jgi:hypothetical protein
MNRRSFLQHSLCAPASVLLAPLQTVRTHHVIVIGSSGGFRKRDYYEGDTLCPNIYRLSREAFVFEEDHCERVASHDGAFSELIRGREFDSSATTYPTVLDYVGHSIQIDTIHQIPQVMQSFRPRVVLCRETAHDVGHESYEKYLEAVTATDAAVGRLFDWVKAHPYFSSNTAIVIRPEFGRDDEVNEHGQLHHSYGFYSTHRVASIFWGPDFNRGVDRKTVVHAVDLTPTLAKIFGFDATYGQGAVLPGLFRTLV